MCGAQSRPHGVTAPHLHSTPGSRGFTAAFPWALPSLGPPFHSRANLGRFTPAKTPTEQPVIHKNVLTEVLDGQTDFRFIHILESMINETRDSGRSPPSGPFPVSSAGTGVSGPTALQTWFCDFPAQLLPMLIHRFPGFQGFVVIDAKQGLSVWRFYLASSLVDCGHQVFGVSQNDAEKGKTVTSGLINGHSDV